MLANSYKYEQGILPVEVANVLYSSSMELNLDLQRSLAACYSKVTFSFPVRLLELFVSEEILF
jgi:hypothetical protein